MNRGQAWTRLKAMVSADTAPVLDAAEIELLLNMHQVADSAGVAPGASGYVDTWDLNRAACEGWRWKAAKAAGSFDFNADGASYSRSQMLAQCERMVAQYARRVIGSVPVRSSTVLAARDGDLLEDEDEQV